MLFIALFIIISLIITINLMDNNVIERKNCTPIH